VSVTGWEEKGRTAARSARSLLDGGDHDGAVNRAYFAMFHMARAALAGIGPELGQVKRHATVIGRFGRYMVKERGVDVQMGRALSLAFDLRTIADYEPIVVDLPEASAVVASAERFLIAVEPFLETPT
jgi:uncharacterized protein (UPF0332 family)